jgi:hypothetical protein
MCGNDQARTVNKAVIDRIAQIDGGPVRIQRSHIAQRRKAVAHVLLRKMQSRQRFGCGALKDLLSEIEAIQAEMNMSIDKSRHHRPVGQINNSRRSRTTYRLRKIGNDTVLNQDFGRPGERVA